MAYKIMLDTGATCTYIDADSAHDNLSSIEQVVGSQSATTVVGTMIPIMEAIMTPLTIHKCAMPVQTLRQKPKR